MTQPNLHLSVDTFFARPKSVHILARFSRFASAMLTRMNSITSSGANSREASPAKEGRGATKHQIIAAAAASSAVDFDSAADETPITIRLENLSCACVNKPVLWVNFC